MTDNAQGNPTALGIREYLISNSPWVDPERTVDTVKIGDPAREVRKAGVCWYASIETIRAAHEAGCDLLICHEPTFWEHAAPELQWRDKAPGVAKRKFLEKTGMVILRAHDTWDQWPEIGIRDSWARFLGLENRIWASTEHNFHAIYEVRVQTLLDFAEYVADKIKALGEDSVHVMGNPDCLVSRPAIGVGCIGPDTECVEAGADVAIVCYDGASYWGSASGCTRWAWPSSRSSTGPPRCRASRTCASTSRRSSLASSFSTSPCIPEPGPSAESSA